MADSNTPRRSVFAVWRWSRWTWCVINSIVIITYLLLPPVIFLMLNENSKAWFPHVQIYEICDAIFAPAEWLADYAPVLEDIWDWEEDTVYWMFGIPNPNPRPLPEIDIRTKMNDAM